MATILLTDDLKDLPPLPEFTEREWNNLKKGEFFKRHESFTDDSGHKGGRGVAYVVVDRSPQKVWDQILDFDRYPEFFPSVSKCRITRQQENEIFVSFVIKLGMIIKIKYHIHHTFFPSQSRMTWVVDESKKNDFKQSTGMWTAWPLDGGKALIGYTVSLESGRSVPKIVEDIAAQSGLTKVMASIQKRVNSDGKHRR